MLKVLYSGSGHKGLWRIAFPIKQCLHKRFTQLSNTQIVCHLSFMNPIFMQYRTLSSALCSFQTELLSNAIMKFGK